MRSKENCGASTDFTHSQGSPEETWLSRLNRDHRLVGQIWNSKDRSFVPREVLIEEMVSCRYLLFGERHDNPDHHRLQAELLKAVVKAGRRPAVVFEMLDVAHQEAIDQYLTANPEDVDGLANLVQWDASGWPEWPMYRPVFASTMHNRLQVIAGNLTRKRAADIATKGTAALDPAFAARHDLNDPLSKEIEAHLIAHLREAHCGCIPEPMLAPMLLVQRARDALLADRLHGSDPESGAVLIAGSGHVRVDFGVPAYLQRLRPKQQEGRRASRVDAVAESTARVTIAPTDPPAYACSLSFEEVAAGIDQPKFYAHRYGVDDLPFDFVWFTPRANDEDPCEELRERFAPCPKQP